MTSSRSSICNFFSEEIPPPPGAWKKKVNVQKKTKVSEEKNLRCSIRNSFLFWTNKKKVSPYERKFLLFLPLKCWSNIFWLLWGFIRWCVNVFFLFVQNKKESRKLHRRFFLSLTFVLFWTFIFFFHAPGVGGISSEKKLQIDDRDIVLLSKSFSRRMIWKKKMVFYLRKTNAIIWYFHLLCQKSKKNSILKKVVFSLNVTFFKNCLHVLTML